MKNTILFLRLFILGSVVFLGCNSGVKDENKMKRKEVSLSFSGAFAMYPLVQVWAEEYKKIHPEIRLDIQAGGAGKGLTDVLAGAVDVGMFSRELTDAEKAKGIWWVGLCKDAVIPTMSAQNPLLLSIQKRGLKQQEFKAIFIDKSIVSWNQLLGNGSDENVISVYTRADAAGAADAWASFLGAKQENIKGVGVSGDPGVADAVRRDPKAIGYNNTLFVFEASSGKKIPGIEIVPIDINGDGKIDDSENFYSDLHSFLKAVKEGTFPSPPARELYFITKGKPVKKEVLDFFQWCLTEGQQYVSSAGFVPLSQSAISEQLGKINP